MLVEVQLLQVILQGGSFGVLVLFAVWLVQRGVPMFREMMEVQRKELMGSAAQQRQDFMAELEEKRKEFLASLEAIEARHAIEQEECRRERREVAKSAREERDGFRVLLQDVSNKYQSALLEIKRLPDAPRT